MEASVETPKKTKTPKDFYYEFLKVHDIEFVSNNISSKDEGDIINLISLDNLKGIEKIILSVIKCSGNSKTVNILVNKLLHIFPEVSKMSTLFKNYEFLNACIKKFINDTEYVFFNELNHPLEIEIEYSVILGTVLKCKVNYSSKILSYNIPIDISNLDNYDDLIELLRSNFILSKIELNAEYQRKISKLESLYDIGHPQVVITNNIDGIVTKDIGVYDFGGSRYERNTNDENRVIINKPRDIASLKSEYNGVYLAPVANVFSYRFGEYKSYDIDSIELYKYRGEELKSELILNNELLEIINFMIQSHGVKTSGIIDGKGEGTFIINTGKPGVGKTLTSEVLSEVFEKPLYKVSAMNLGTNPSYIEENLNLILDRANRWGAFLLIDEADNYIRERNGELLGDSVIGIFLRKLEYNKGIIFMSSNINNIDQAIKSRANLILKYPDHTKDEQIEIWKRNLKEFYDDDLVKVIVEKYPLAGRDIFNISTMLKRYCIFNNTKITLELFERLKQFNL